MARAKRSAAQENPFRAFLTDLNPAASAAVEESELVWEYTPPPLDEFITSPAYLGLPPLSARQLKAFKEGLEQDGVNLFAKENKYNELVLVWGKGCIAGETPIKDETSGEVKTAAEWEADGRPLTVMTPQGTAAASSMYLKGYEPLYRVTLADGRSVRVTACHRFLTQDGLKATHELTPGDTQLLALPPSASHQTRGRLPGTTDVAVSDPRAGSVGQGCGQVAGSVPTTGQVLGSDHASLGSSAWVGDQRRSPTSRGAYALRSSQIGAGSPRDCQTSLHSCDGQPRLGEGSVPGVVPSQAGVLGHNQGGWRVDALEDVPERTRVYLGCVHEPAGLDQASNPSSILGYYTQIKDIRADGYGAFYDLEVPEVGSYFDANGIASSNSGKDYVSSIVISYFTYVLLCLKNPHRFLNLAPGENIDIVNVATRMEQAADVFFSKLVARIERPCFNKFRPKVTRQKIQFPGKKITIHSLHSKAQKWEGYNIIAWVMDEADAFQTSDGHENAKEVYGVLRSSANTRFPDKRWVGIIISYPRSEIGFVLKHAQFMRKHDYAYVDIAAHWEVHPNFDPEHPNFRDFTWVRVHDAYDVPEPFVQDFEREPVQAAMTLMCVPPPVEGAFFEYPDLIEHCTRDYQPVVWFMPTVTQREIETDGRDPETGDLVRQVVKRTYTAVHLARKVRDAEPYHYYIHGDPGETKDAFALVLCHTLPDTEHVETLELNMTLNRVEVDLVLEWKPTHNKPVDYLNVRDVILKLCEWYPVIQVSFDKFQSATVIQELIEKGINARSMAFSRAQQLEMFRALKILVYAKLISWPLAHWPLIEPQLRYLIQKGTQITHKDNLSAKDLADALAAAAWFASGASLGRHGREILESMYGINAVGQTGIVRKKLTA